MLKEIVIVLYLSAPQIPTVIIGCLPTYSTGSYTAGVAAPILLTIMRLLQVGAHALLACSLTCLLAHRTGAMPVCMLLSWQHKRSYHCLWLQGLAMGGEFGPAIIYISELAPVASRGRLVACLQMTVNIGEAAPHMTPP